MFFPIVIGLRFGSVYGYLSIINIPRTGLVYGAKYNTIAILDISKSM